MTYQQSTHCPDCFKPSSQPICVCGFNRNIKQANNSLPFFTPLKGGYVIGRFIASGSFAMVYSAIHQDAPNTPLVIKEYYPEQLASRVENTIIPKIKTEEVHKSFLERFRQEAELLRQCQKYLLHGIVRVGELINAPENNTVYFVMERLFGVTLQNVIDEKKQLTVEELACWLKPFLENLQALHNRNIYHRDLKPENIFLRNAPDCLSEPVIMDFGVAREGVLDPFDGTNMIGTGTYCYRAPEMVDDSFRRAHKYSIAAHTDIYAVGAIIFYCLYGKPPQDFQFINKEKNISINELDSALITEPELHAVILECLKQNPKDRPKNVKVLLEKLAFLWQRYETIVPINAELNSANTKIEELETELENVKNDKLKLEANLEFNLSEYNKVREEHNETMDEVIKLKTALVDLQSNNKELKQKIDDLGSYWHIANAL